VTVTVRWLDNEEMRAWRGLHTMQRLLFDRLERCLGARSGLSLPDYEVLVRLSEQPERRLRMTQLAAATLASKSRLSHQVTRLERAGWVRRQECPSDGRGAYAVLTDEGFATLVAAAPGHLEDVRRHLIDLLDREQVRQLAGVTETVNAALEGHPPRG